MPQNATLQAAAQEEAKNKMLDLFNKRTFDAGYEPLADDPVEIRTTNSMQAGRILTNGRVNIIELDRTNYTSQSSALALEGVFNAIEARICLDRQFVATSFEAFCQTRVSGFMGAASGVFSGKGSSIRARNQETLFNAQSIFYHDLKDAIDAIDFLNPFCQTPRPAELKQKLKELTKDLLKKVVLHEKTKDKDFAKAQSPVAVAAATCKLVNVTGDEIDDILRGAAQDEANLENVRNVATPDGGEAPEGFGKAKDKELLKRIYFNSENLEMPSGLAGSPSAAQSQRTHDNHYV